MSTKELYCVDCKWSYVSTHQNRREGTTARGEHFCTNPLLGRDLVTGITIRVPCREVRNAAFPARGCGSKGGWFEKAGGVVQIYPKADDPEGEEERCPHCGRYHIFKKKEVK